MKISFLDLNHTTCGVHTNTVPLGCGLIATYLKKNIPEDFDIKLFKELEDALTTFESWMPEVIGLALYSWNTELNLYISKLIKEKNPECIIIAGGPNLEQSKKGKLEFLKANKHVDICVAYDGEIPFTEIIRRVLAKESINKIKENPPAGSYAINPENLEFSESPEPPPSIPSLDLFGPIYEGGIFDKFLKKGYNPFLQTHRGCPFTCAFCHTGDSYYSRMKFLSPEIFRKDMEYLGKMFEGRQDITLYLANTNMSLFKQDFDIAKVIREIQEKYNWPRFININSGKDPEKLIKMLSIINFEPAIALQTLTPHVLENIARRNIPFDEYCKFQQEVSKKGGAASVTELILSLPGETKETFLETIKKVLNSSVQDINIFTLMRLKGTPLASKDISRKYEHMIKHRIVPRQFSTINGKKIFDTEEIIVGTKEMPYEDYLELRGLCFTISSFFGARELIPLKKFLSDYKIDISKWIFNIHSQISNYENLNRVYKSFMDETEKELFNDKASLEEFFSKPENYQSLLEGKLGDNLIRKYRCILLSEHYKSYLDIAISEAKKLVNFKLGDEKSNDMINDLKKYLSTRDLGQILIDRKIPGKQQAILKYNILDWLKSSKDAKLLEEFKIDKSYIIKFPLDTEQKLNDFLNMNKSKSLSLQILYRDGGIKDLWPVWISKEEQGIIDSKEY